MKAHGLDFIDILAPLNAGDPAIECSLPREVCQCLMANLFLCTLREPRSKNMPSRSFLKLLCSKEPQEYAKVRMFIHYFDRCRLRTTSGTTDPSPLPLGKLHIFRRRIDLDEALWGVSTAPLLPMAVMRQNVGFEDAEGHNCLHADFANKFLGGGVLSGGCVQEEIRFAICPDLMIGALLCPCMEDREAIQIVGAEQYSCYAGYAFSLRFDGDFVDQSSRTVDGTVLNGIAAIDALDGRYIQPFDVAAQMQTANMLREMNKAFAGFGPPSTAALQSNGDNPFSHLATGNWGCGVFGGFVPLKAVLQWMAASQGSIKVKYFPFDYDQHFGPRFQHFCDTLVEKHVTVGMLWKALLVMQDKVGAPEAAGEEGDRLDAFLETLWTYVVTENSDGFLGARMK